MNYQLLKTVIQKENAVQLLYELYAAEDTKAHAERYLEIAKGFCESFGNREFELFTSAGRTEILGNHTDHNHGLVAAGSVNLDCIAAAAPNDTNEIRIISSTFNQNFRIGLGELAPPRRRSGTAALVRGVIAGLLRQGYKCGGLDIFTTSIVPGGAGLSSSASFEMLLCTIIDYYFNGNKMDILSFARAGQYSENIYWDKKSGLMDQIACAAGGITGIDFSDTEHPLIRQISFLPDELGLDLVIVNTGKGHSDLSDEYSSVPEEMHSVAAFFGKEYLSELTEEDVIRCAYEIRQKCSDRPLLRALHFFEENRRVRLLYDAMENKDRQNFLQLILESGNSSWKWLQNCYLASEPQRQDVTTALAFTELFLKDCGACRVHGGGFAGTIAVWLPKESTHSYMEYINGILGENSTYLIRLRRHGACRLDFS